jgi:telomere length regulation protein
MVRFLLFPLSNSRSPFSKQAEPHSAGGSSLSARLAEPLTSTTQLLDLLVPPLCALSILPANTAFASHTSSSSDFDPARFVKRQLGLVQKVLVEQVWPDWEAALEAEHGKVALLLFERYFIPPSDPTASPLGGEVALSAYAVLNTLLSAKAASTIQPRSLEIISSLLVKLSRDFDVERVYLTTLAGANVPGADITDDADEEDEADPASLARWEQTLKDVLNVPTRVANAWGAQQQKAGGRGGSRVPPELEPEYVLLLPCLSRIC